jgi:hypothetical protein
MVRVSVIAAAAVVAGTLSTATPSQAAEWPWCADMYDRGGTSTNCGFANLRQCEANISGMNGRCYPNPLYPHQQQRRRNDRYR